MPKKERYPMFVTEQQTGADPRRDHTAEEGFDFLGYRVVQAKSRRTGPANARASPA